MRINYHDALAIGRVGGAHPGGIELSKRIFSNIKITNENKLIDIGCGNGDTSIFLAETYDCEVFSVDSHPDMIRNLTARLKKEMLPVTPVQALAENLPFPDSFFDLAASESVLIFTDLQKSLKEIWRVLKPQSRLLMIEMSLEEELSRGELQPLKALYNINKILSEKEWISSLVETGFINVNVLISSTVSQELSKGFSQYNDSFRNIKMDPQAERLLVQQSLLLAKFGDKIGFRVIEAFKP